MLMQSSAYNHSSANGKMDRPSLRPSVPSSNVVPSLTTPTSCRSRSGIDISGWHVDGAALHLLPPDPRDQSLFEDSYEFLISYLTDSHVVPVRLWPQLMVIQIRLWKEGENT